MSEKVLEIIDIIEEYVEGGKEEYIDVYENLEELVEELTPKEVEELKEAEIFDNEWIRDSLIANLED